MTVEHAKLALAMYLLAGLGALFHWFKRWARGQTRDGLLEYMNTYFGYTLLSIFSAMGAITTQISGGMLLDGSPQSLAMAFLTGYSIDSAVNRGSDDGGA